MRRFVYPLLYLLCVFTLLSGVMLVAQTDRAELVATIEARAQAAVNENERLDDSLRALLESLEDGDTGSLTRSDMTQIYIARFNQQKDNNQRNRVLLIGGVVFVVLVAVFVWARRRGDLRLSCWRRQTTD